MKKVNLFLEDEEYEKLVEQKKDMTWVEFVMKLAKNGNDVQEIKS